MTGRAHKAAIVLPATRASPPVQGYIVYETLKALACYNRIMWDRAEVWIAGGGRVVPLRESDDLPPDPEQGEAHVRALQEAVNLWLAGRERQGVMKVVYARKESPLGEAVMRELGKHRGFFPLVTVWCDATETALHEELAGQFDDPDYCLSCCSNLSKLILLLGDLLLLPEDYDRYRREHWEPPRRRKQDP